VPDLAPGFSFSSGKRRLAFAPDGKTLATGDFGGVIDLWDVGVGSPAAAAATPCTASGGVIGGFYPLGCRSFSGFFSFM
jgi:hypothetical protein